MSFKRFQNLFSKLERGGCKNFLSGILVSWELVPDVNRQDYMNLKHACIAEETISQAHRQPKHGRQALLAILQAGTTA